MSHVDLGFAQRCPPWQVESYHFPSKIGGKPAWLDLRHIPEPQSLLCELCQQPLTFLCQVYAPFEEDDANFHRTIFIFICRDPKCCQPNSNCNVKAFRCRLPRINEFYSSEPPDDRPYPEFDILKWTSLCKVCGCRGHKKCSKCQRAMYCSKGHQVVDWKEGHKSECQNRDIERHSQVLYPEFELVMEEEGYIEKIINEAEEMQKFEQLETEANFEQSDLEKYAAGDTDKTFSKFKKRIADNTDQVLRYERGGAPLWISNEPKPEIIPNCEFCSAPRQFEFQIMPQLLSVLHENDLDIGVIAVYTCTKSCIEGDAYKSEFVFKQDVQN